MKNIKGLLLAVVALALVIAAVVLVIKIVHGALNTILGILVIIALIYVVIKKRIESKLFNAAVILIIRLRWSAVNCRSAYIAIL